MGDQHTQAPDGAAPPPGDAHTRTRWRWLDQVLADRELTPFAFQVAYVVASYVSRETGEAWPSQATIAEKIGGKERGVRSAIDQLSSRGHLTISTPNGRKGVNHYRLAQGSAAEASEVHRHGGAGEHEIHGHSSAYETEPHRHGGDGEDAFHRHCDAGKDGFHRHGHAANTFE